MSQPKVDIDIKWYQYLALGSFVAGWIAKEFGEGLNPVKVRWWQYLSLGSYVAGWIGRAFADGKITRPEITELVGGIFGMLGIERAGIDLSSANDLIKGILDILGVSEIVVQD